MGEVICGNNVRRAGILIGTCTLPSGHFRACTPGAATVSNPEHPALEHLRRLVAAVQTAGRYGVSAVGPEFYAAADYLESVAK